VETVKNVEKGQDVLGTYKNSVLHMPVSKGKNNLIITYSLSYHRYQFTHNSPEE
jgi:hypothetical protein